MNIALPTIVVFLLLLPGFIARSRIKRAERLSLDYSPFGQVVTEAVVWAAVLHGVALMLLAWPLGRALRADLLLQLFATDSRVQAQALVGVSAQARDVAGYLAGTVAAAYALPSWVRMAVSRWRLDRAGSRWSGWFRFSGAPWYYLLSGADFPRDEVPDLIAISAIVNVSGTPWLYTGFLDDYLLDPEGRLDRLILQQVMRRPLERDKPEGRAVEVDESLRRFYAVDGDYFVLRYDEAITLNVEYIRLAPASEEV